jgi:hypothetical protein
MRKILVVADMKSNTKARDSFFKSIKIDHVDAKEMLKHMDLHDAMDEVAILKNECSHFIYIIDESGVSPIDIAEMLVTAIKSPKSTAAAFLPGGDDWYNISMTEVMRKIASSGATVLEHNLDAIVDYINGLVVEIPFDPNVIECLIKRDGPTTMVLGKRRYSFEQNKNGDVVCPVLAADHRKHLLSIPDFRVYQAEKLKPKEFTDAEIDFHRQWKTMSSLRFNAFVNGNLSRFKHVSQKLLNLAIMKWHAQLPAMDCPLEHKDFVGASPEISEPPKPPELPVDNIPATPDQPIEEIFHLSWTPEQWEAWHQSWLRLDFNKFKAMLEVQENEDALLAAPDELFDKAEEKWKRLAADADGDPEPWPYDDEDPEDIE